jgi:hypothetical protein
MNQAAAISTARVISEKAHRRPVPMKPLLLSALALGLATVPAAAQVITFNSAIQPIPDGSGGLASVQTVTGATAPLASLRVTLDVGGVDGFLGDLFVTLQHQSGAYTVLLNRPGRDVSSPSGYSDRRMSVTFDAAGQDIHRYRDFSGTPAGGLLTGTWSPDGRTTDPANTLTTDTRTAGLGGFGGINPNGEWILFLADVNPGGQSFLNSWSLELVPVPEPATATAMAAGALAATALVRRTIRRRTQA